MRIQVELPKSYRLLNHGPVVLVGSAAKGRDNVMPAAWVMPVDFDPPLVAAVIAGGTFTRELVESSGELTLSIPPASMLDALYDSGQVSGREGDKWARFGLMRLPASRVAAPLVDGCLGASSTPHSRRWTSSSARRSLHGSMRPSGARVALQCPRTALGPPPRGRAVLRGAERAFVPEASF